MMEDIARRNGVTWRHIPYKGESDVLQGVLGGQLRAYAGSTTELPMVQSGKMRMLVTWGGHRSAQFPDVPPLHELDSTPPAYAPFGIAAPKGLPPAVLPTLHDPFKRVADTEEHTSELQSLMRISYAVFCLKKKKNNNQVIMRLSTSH